MASAEPNIIVGYDRQGIRTGLRFLGEVAEEEARETGPLCVVGTIQGG